MEADPSSPHNIRSEDGKIAVQTGPEKDSENVFCGVLSCEFSCNTIWTQCVAPKYIIHTQSKCFVTISRICIFII